MVATCGRFLRRNFHFLDCHCLCEQKRKELEDALVARIGFGLPDSDRLSHTRTTHYFKTMVSVGLHETTTTGSVLVEYQEYQGLGPPSGLGRDFGSVGDTYVDLTPNKHNLYAKISQSSWAVWPGPMVASNGLKHPIYPKLYLRCKPRPTGKGYVQDIGWQISYDYVDYQLSAHEIITKALESRVQRGPAPKHGLRGTKKRKLLSDSQQSIQSKKPRMKSMTNNVIAQAACPAQGDEISFTGNQALITLTNHGHISTPEKQNDTPTAMVAETQETMDGQSIIFQVSCDQSIPKSPIRFDADSPTPQENDTINLNNQSSVTVSALDLNPPKTSLCGSPATRHSESLLTSFGDILVVANDSSPANPSTSRSPITTSSQIPTSIEAPYLSLPISSDHTLAVANCSSSATTASQIPSAMVAPCQSVPLSSGEMLMASGCNSPENACSASESPATTPSQVSIPIAAPCPSPLISSSETATMASCSLTENACTSNTSESPMTTSSQISIPFFSGKTSTLANCNPPQNAYESWRSLATTLSQPIHSLPISSRDILAIASTKSSQNACRAPRCSNTTSSRIPSPVNSDEASYTPVIEINGADLTTPPDKLNIDIPANDAGLNGSENLEVQGVEGDKYIPISHACEQNIQDLTPGSEHTTDGQPTTPTHLDTNAPSCFTQNTQPTQTESTMDMDKLSFASKAFAPTISSFASEEPIPASPTSVDFGEYLMPQSPLVEQSHSTSPGAVEPSFLPLTRDAAVGDNTKDLVEKGKPDNQISIESHEHSTSCPVEPLEMLSNTETDMIPIDEETDLHPALHSLTPIPSIQDGVGLLVNESDTAPSGNNSKPVHGDGDSESVSKKATPSVRLTKTTENENFEETFTRSQLEPPETQPPDSNNLNHGPPRASSQPEVVLCQGSDGINEGFTSTSPSKCQLKDIHISVLFAEYSACLLCRICLATSSRVFKVKPDSPQTVHAIQQHCNREHAEDCEVLLSMSENELQDLCTELNVCTAGKQAPAGTNS